METFHEGTFVYQLRSKKVAGNIVSAGKCCPCRARQKVILSLQGKVKGNVVPAWLGSW